MGNYQSENFNQINEIVMELKIYEYEIKKEINILCDKDKLIKDNKENEDYYKKNNIDHPKEFNYFK